MPDILEVARTLMGAVSSQGADARLLGGVAVALRCPSATLPGLSRSYQDLDAVVMRRSVQAFSRACESVGFEADRRFNALHGERRLLFHQGDLALDAFIQVFEQSHRLDFSGRFKLGEPTVQLADLLLTKLQVYEINRKDLTDAITILVDHPPTRGAELDLTAFVDVLRQDWGWYTTVGDNLDRLPELAREVLPDPRPVLERLRILREAMAGAPKSMAWKLRARVGRRVPWYQLPEEKVR